MARLTDAELKPTATIAFRTFIERRV